MIMQSLRFVPMDDHVRLYNRIPIFSSFVIGLIGVFIWREVFTLATGETRETIGVILYGAFGVLSLVFLFLTEAVVVSLDKKLNLVEVRRYALFHMFSKTSEYPLPLGSICPASRPGEKV